MEYFEEKIQHARLKCKSWIFCKLPDAKSLPVFLTMLRCFSHGLGSLKKDICNLMYIHLVKHYHSW
jgi:hypothetical protein